jgi:hypothetical protein
MEIRVLNANDASAYWKIRLEALECDPEAFGSSVEEHRALAEDEVAARISYDPANKFVVGAFSGERLLGTAGFFRDKGLKVRHKGHIWGVYVTSEARSRGSWPEDAPGSIGTSRQNRWARTNHAIRGH